MACRQCGGRTDGRWLARWRNYSMPGGQMTVCQECADRLANDSILVDTGLTVEDRSVTTWPYCENESNYGYPCNTDGCPHCGGSK